MLLSYSKDHKAYHGISVRQYPALMGIIPRLVLLLLIASRPLSMLSTRIMTYVGLYLFTSPLLELLSVWDSIAECRYFITWGNSRTLLLLQPVYHWSWRNLVIQRIIRASSGYWGSYLIRTKGGITHPLKRVPTYGSTSRGFIAPYDFSEIGYVGLIAGLSVRSFYVLCFLSCKSYHDIGNIPFFRYF